MDSLYCHTVIYLFPLLSRSFCDKRFQCLVTCTSCDFNQQTLRVLRLPSYKYLILSFHSLICALLHTKRRRNAFCNGWVCTFWERYLLAPFCSFTHALLHTKRRRNAFCKGWVPWVLMRLLITWLAGTACFHTSVSLFSHYAVCVTSCTVWEYCIFMVA